MQRPVESVGIEPDREGQARLGVEVDEQHPPSELAERETEGVDGGRLGDATFLVGDRQHASHDPSLRTAGPGCPGRESRHADGPWIAWPEL